MSGSREIERGEDRFLFLQGRFGIKTRSLSNEMRRCCHDHYVTEISKIHDFRKGENGENEL